MESVPEATLEEVPSADRLHDMGFGLQQHQTPPHQVSHSAELLPCCCYAVPMQALYIEYHHGNSSPDELLAWLHAHLNSSCHGKTQYTRIASVHSEHQMGGQLLILPASEDMALSIKIIVQKGKLLCQTLSCSNKLTQRHG